MTEDDVPVPPMELMVVAWAPGTRVTKIRGKASWTGRIVGYYSTAITPEGYCVESENEPGSVHVLARDQLAEAPPDPTPNEDFLVGDIAVMFHNAMSVKCIPSDYAKSVIAKVRAFDKAMSRSSANSGE